MFSCENPNDFDGHFFKTDLFQHPVNAGAVAVGHVEHAGDLGLHGEERIGRHDVLYIDEIARLFAVAVNGDGLVLERAVDENGNRRRKLALGILARAKDIEIAQASGGQAAFGGEHLASNTHRPV